MKNHLEAHKKLQTTQLHYIHALVEMPIPLLKNCRFCLDHSNYRHRSCPELVHFISIPASHHFDILCIIQKLKGDLLTVLKAERDELETSLSKEKLHTLKLKQELAEAEARNSDLSKVTYLTVEVPFSF